MVAAVADVIDIHISRGHGNLADAANGGSSSGGILQTRRSARFLEANSRKSRRGCAPSGSGIPEGSLSNRHREFVGLFAAGWLRKADLAEPRQFPGLCMVVYVTGGCERGVMVAKTVFTQSFCRFWYGIRWKTVFLPGRLFPSGMFP